MATYNKIQAFVEHMAEKVHNLGSDQLVIALTTLAEVPVASTDAVLADIVPIAYTNLSSRNITTSSSAQSAGTYKLVLTDLVLTASGGAVATFREVVLYNDTPTSPADPLISWWDHGANVTLADTDTYTIDFDATNGVLQVA